MSSHYQKAYFLLSVADVKQLPPDEGIEIAIVGRSNAGKSSTLNRLTGKKQLARVSKTPGRTQLINIFVIDPKRRIVDLPGYGFAKAPLAAQKKWLKNVDNYLETRSSLQGLIMVMDIRHPLKKLDLQLLDYCKYNELHVHILLNKSDKLSKKACLETLKNVKAALTNYGDSVTFQCYSAISGLGVSELYKLLDKWYQY